MIKLVNINLSFGIKTLFKDVNIQINNTDKIGIIGENGTGKTTLLKIISKDIVPESGSVVNTERLSFVKQSTDINIFDIYEKFSDADYISQFYKQLKMLNFENDSLLDSGNLEPLSCGEKMKISIADALSSEPTTIILDEPTNHLDRTGKKVLIKAINDFDGGVIIVSHDIDFLNKTVNKIFEVKNGNINEYCGNYNDYLEQKAIEKSEVQKNYEKTIKEQKRIKEQIDFYNKIAHIADKGVNKQGGSPSDNRHMAARGRANRSAGKLSRFASAKIARLEDELNKDIEAPEKDKKIKYKLQKTDIPTDIAVFAKNLTFSYDDKVIFDNCNFVINSGDKVGIVGDNGVGKTTLVNLILKNLTPQSGELFTPKNLKIVTMYQDVYDLPEDKTVNELSLDKDKNYRTDFLTNLISMGLDKKILDTKIKFLSSGEKMRIKLSQVILSDANMIILDEPTNHLDIKNKEYLEKVLSDYIGTVVIISHDENFIDNVTNKKLVISNHKIMQAD